MARQIRGSAGSARHRLSNRWPACDRRAMQARSIEYQPGGGVRLVEVAVADPGPGEVQVRAAACGVCAWDLFTYRHGSDVGSVRCV